VVDDSLPVLQGDKTSGIHEMAARSSVP